MRPHASQKDAQRTACCLFRDRIGQEHFAAENAFSLSPVCCRCLNPKLRALRALRAVHAMHASNGGRVSMGEEELLELLNAGRVGREPQRAASSDWGGDAGNGEAKDRCVALGAAPWHAV